MERKENGKRGGEEGGVERNLKKKVEEAEVWKGKKRSGEERKVE